MTIRFPERKPDLIISLPFWGLNDLIAEAKRYKQAYSFTKKRLGNQVLLWARAQRMKKTAGAYSVYCQMHPPNLRADPDNYLTGLLKITLDALQKGGYVRGDRWADVKGIFVLPLPSDKKNPRAELWIEECE